MNVDAVFHIKREKAAGFAAALALHAVLLYALWSYQIIPPPAEALTVFVSYINPSLPAKMATPVAPKPSQPVPVKPETPRTVSPVAPQLLTTAAPVTSPAEPVAPPPPVAKAPPAPAQLMVPVSAQPATVPASSPVAPVSQPVLQKEELSVSCTERTSPVYPKQSLRLSEQGKTVLQVELDELGRVFNTRVKATSGFPRLDEAAITAVKTWHCTPARRNGVAVRSVALQPFNFILKGR